MKKKQKALLLTSLLASSLIVTACSSNEESKVEEKEVETSEKTSETNETNKTKETEKENETTEITEATETTENNSNVAEENTAEKLSLFNVEEKYDYNPTDHSDWKLYPYTTLQATVEGRGKTASEEGFAVLVVQDRKTNVSKVYSLKDETAQYTFKYVEWIDENNVFVIVGYAHGTVTKGGDLYELNLTDNTVIPVLTDLNGTEEITSITKKDDSTYTYVKHVYDSQMEGHYEEGTLSYPAK